ncbi:hypothetical protein SeMB42_g07724 [Synchytrium endobioticum]|uniref:CWF21 domain-containing protein n=1 Tax=Synchytrium endobioticum TaxID=286115 RepID=A0A507C0N9_9FUNG|nr:hypothetical protein SeMB42_g07724 [Synchytrium endobioticum]TPX39009.1 hypothetical protein SeLEV6574_g07457 [Synchytrium endobioticum]
MYNGIGLSTVRGSGTNGYVQRNLSNLQFKRQPPRYDDNDKSAAHVGFRPPNKDILAHDSKRAVEIRYDAVDQLRQELLAQVARETLDLKDDIKTGTHQISEAKERENARLMDAFGIKKDEYVEGGSFDPEVQARKRAARQAAYERKQAEIVERAKERDKAQVERQRTDDEPRTREDRPRKDDDRRDRAPRREDEYERSRENRLPERRPEQPSKGRDDRGSTKRRRPDSEEDRSKSPPPKPRRQLER